MDETSQSKHTGRKIWYGAVIVFSALVLIICAVSVVGTWVLQSKLSDTTVALLQAAENLAGRAQLVIDQVQEPLGEIHKVSTNVSEASSKLSQDVQDKGLLMLLLPPEQEQKLVTLGTKVQDTLATIHEVLSSAAEMYQAIDRMPFISLPKPDMEKVREVEQSATDIRIAIEEVKSNVAEVRSGAAEKVGVITDIATRIADRSAQVLVALAALDAELEDFQVTLARVRSAVPTAFALAAFLLTLALVYVGYTQVEIIRLFLDRWRLLQAMSAQVPPEVPPDAAQPVPVEPVSELPPGENPVADEGEEEKAQE